MDTPWPIVREYLLAALRHALYIVVYFLCHLAEVCLAFVGWQNRPKPDQVVEVRKIVGRSRVKENDRFAVWSHFLTWNSGFDTADRLFGPNVLIYHQTSEFVQLVEMDQSVHEALNADSVAFGYASTFYLARRVLRVGHAEFQKAVDEHLGHRLRMNVGMMATAGRSGSTVFTRAVGHYCPSVMAFSEPMYLVTLAKLYHSTPKEQFMPILSAAFRYTHRIVPGKTGYFIKLMLCMALQEDIQELFPEVKFLFLHRKDDKKVVESFYKVFLNVPTYIVRKHLVRFGFYNDYDTIWGAAREVNVYAALRHNEKELHLKNSYEFSIWMWASVRKMHAYLVQRLSAFPTVYYEDLVKDTLFVMRFVAEFCEYDGPFDEPAALDGMKHDSQGGTFLSREALAKISHPKIDGVMQQRITSFCKAANVPVIQ